MKRVLSGVLMSVFALALAMSAAIADTAGTAVGHVYMNVNPNITVGINTATVNAGTVQSGEFGATVSFRVDANEEAVALFVEASDLFKGDDPTNTEVPPIPLMLETGALIDPTNANPLEDGSDIAPFSYEPVGEEIEGFPTYITDPIVFESSQAGVFSQDVLVSLGWDLSNPEQTQGEYSGVVRLSAFINVP